ncbi:MAG: phage Gp37/Gp68 family protein [Myxococcota bacterium]
MSATTIEWTDETWNPVRGCTPVTPGCDHCYAKTFAERFIGVEGHPYQQGFDLRLVSKKLVEPLTWAKPRMVFVNSMSDLFHGKVPMDFIARFWAVMGLADWHVYQVLTKRAPRMRRLVQRLVPLRGMVAPPQHVWLGVSVEDRKHGLPRIDDLRDTPAAVRFLSIEPLLEDLGQLDLQGIDWVIVGGESGPGARRMDPAWVRSIRDQCADQGVPFFFKQWGGVRKKKAGRELDGRVHDDQPQVHRAKYPGRREAKRRRGLLRPYELVRGQLTLGRGAACGS